MTFTDTIVALSSPSAGSGFRAILRLSGPDAHRLACELVDIEPGESRRYVPELDFRHWPAGNRLASLLRFHAPGSFTGQDIAELHVPNSPGLLRWAMEQLLDAARRLQVSARLAEPGEFSARAFFNGKMDLTEAEGIAATINAQNESQLRAAASLREGDLHKEIARISGRIADHLALLEANIDFADEEDIRLVDIERLFDDLSQIKDGLHQFTAWAARADRFDEPPTVVFIGEPNAGKSSLVNALARVDRSIVSPIAGTTRDILPVAVHTPKGDIRLIDLPGREEATDDLRRKMMAARETALLKADLIIEVVTHPVLAISSLLIRIDYPADSVTVQNKADLLPPEELRTFDYVPEHSSFIPMRGLWQLVSAKTGLHIDLLREEITRQVWRTSLVGAHFPALNQRHRQILQEARTALADAERLILLDPPRIVHPELLAAELRRGLDLLGQITGSISPDEVLGRIFSTFCIGK